MEAHKERREQVLQQEEEEHKKKIENDDVENNNGTQTQSKIRKAVDDPVAKALIREFIISDDDGGAVQPYDVLAFSRSVHHIDSSLE